MAHQLTGKTIASTYEQLIYRTTTVPSTGTTTTQLMTSEADQTDDIGLPLYISTQRVGIGTAVPNYQLEVSSSTGGDFSIRRDGNIANGNPLGTILFTGEDADADASIIGAYIEAKANTDWDTGPSDNDAPTQINFHTQDATTSDVLGTPRMTIDYNGNVGIGTATPEAALHVSAADDVAIIIDADTGSNKDCTLQFHIADALKWLVGVDDDSDKFCISQTATLANADVTILSSGNVGIGTTVPEGNLHIAADDTVPFLLLSRNKSGDLNPIDNNDVIGAIQFRGYDDQHSNVGGVGAQISAVASGNWDNAGDVDDAPCELHFFTEDDSTTDQVAAGPRMVINKTG